MKIYKYIYIYVGVRYRLQILAYMKNDNSLEDDCSFVQIKYKFEDNCSFVQIKYKFGGWGEKLLKRF